METEIIAAVIGAGAVIVNTIVTTILATKRIEKTVDKQSYELSKKFDDSAQIIFINGEKSAFDALTRLTLSEPTRVRSTRYNPRKIQRQPRYFSSIVSRITGAEFEGENYSTLEKYNRLTSINSEENKQSLIEQVTTFHEKGCNNIILRVTAYKNDFEVLIFGSFEKWEGKL